LTRRLKLIVEGRGDVSATTSLICKCADAFGSNVIVVDPPIRAGEAKKLRRTGELERYVTLAASHDDVEEIFILLDLDDGCVMEYEKEFKHRAAHRLLSEDAPPRASDLQDLDRLGRN
jgi:hypothetical protein